MKSADELRLSFIKANRGRLTMTAAQYTSWLKRVVAEDRVRRSYVEVTDPTRPTWDAWRVAVPPPSVPPGYGRGMRSDLVVLDEWSR